MGPDARRSLATAAVVHLPNLLAVNFYERGDVFRVVDTLNGF